MANNPQEKYGNESHDINLHVGYDPLLRVSEFRPDKDKVPSNKLSVICTFEGVIYAHEVEFTVNLRKTTDRIKRENELPSIFVTSDFEKIKDGLVQSFLFCRREIDANTSDPKSHSSLVEGEFADYHIKYKIHRVNLGAFEVDEEDAKQQLSNDDYLIGVYYQINQIVWRRIHAIFHIVYFQEQEKNDNAHQLEIPVGTPYPRKELEIGNALATKILNEWRSDPAYSNTTILSQDVQQRLAEQAAQIFEQELEQRTALQASSDKVVDPVTGLELPPPARKPYQERGRGENGKRLNVFEHLRDQYADYLDAGLLFSGHIQQIDRPAYEALLYIARKELRSPSEDNEVRSTSDFFQKHGIISGEMLDNPPPHMEREVALVNQARAKNIALGARGRKPKAIDDMKK